MNPNETKVVKAYQKMYELTNPKCGQCRVPNQCCSPEYCELAIEWAKKEWNTELARTDHPRLPLMGPSGCTAAPHFRPLCTVHVCENHYMRDLAFNKTYFSLRSLVERAENKRNPNWYKGS